MLRRKIIIHLIFLGGRAEADELLLNYKHLGDDTFLVRESATIVGIIEKVENRLF